MYVIYIYEEKPKIFSLLYYLLDKKNVNASFIEGTMKFTHAAYESAYKNDGFYFFRGNRTNSGIFNASNINLCVIGDLKTGSKKVEIPDCSTLILNSENVGNFSMKKPAGQYITCGLKEKDTIIFSSFGEVKDEVVLNLQRSINDIHGKQIDGFERRLSLDPYKKSISDDDWLTALGVMLYCRFL